MILTCEAGGHTPDRHARDHERVVVGPRGEWRVGELRSRLVKAVGAQRLGDLVDAGVIAGRTIRSVALGRVSDVLQGAQMRKHPVRVHLCGQAVPAAGDAGRQDDTPPTRQLGTVWHPAHAS